MEKLITFILLLSLYLRNANAQDCLSFDLDFGSTSIIPYCEEKLVTITLTNTCGSDEYFDVYVTSTNYTLPIIVDPMDFTIEQNNNGFRIRKDNFFIEEDATVELQFTFKVTYGTEFIIDFLTKKNSESLYYHQTHVQFFPEMYVLLTGSLTNLLNGNAPGLFPANDACNPNNVRNYVVQGTFVVDQNYCFNGQRNTQSGPGSKMLIYPGASIQVSNSAELNITNMVISTRNNTTCETQTGWVGFQVNNGSSFNITNSEIRDAHWGIKTQPNTKVKYSRTSFIDDYIGMDCGSGVGSKSEVVLSQCKFFPSNGFADAYSGQPSRVGTVPLVGIQAYNTDLVVAGGGTQYAQFNDFQNLRHGIINTDCNLTLSNAQFRAIGLENSGAGFTNSSNAIKIRGIRPKMASIMNCKFYNMQHGIRTMRMNTTIDACNFGDLQTQNYNHIVGYGIIVESSNTPHTIQNCTLRVNQTGILLYHNFYGNASNVIKNNRFLTDQWDDAKGIWGDINSTSWEIHNNYFEPVKGLNSIRTNNCKEFNIHDNDIKYPGSINLNHHAVKLIADEKMNVQCNTVYNGPTNSGLNLHAFDVSSTPNSNFICNSSTTGERQMVFLETNMNALIKGNIYAGSALYGLCVGDDQIMDAIVGEQPLPGSGDPDHGNKWTGSYNTYGAANFSSNSAIMGLSRFLVDEDENAQFLPTLPAGQLGPFFFDEYKESQSFSCSSLTSCAALHPRNREISDVDTLYVHMIDSTLDFEYYAEEQSWTTRYILYKLLRQGDFIAEEGSAFESFLEDNVSTELGLLYNAEFLVKNCLNEKSGYWDTLITGMESLGNLQLQLDTLVPNWEIADSTLLDSLVDQMFFTYAEIDTFSQELTPKWDTISNHLVLRAELMGALLDTLATSSTPAEQLRLALYYMLKKVEDPLYEYDSTEIAELQEIAALCALEGGIGTSLAQAVLGAEYGMVFDRYEHCDFEDSIIIDRKLNEKNSIRITPVPAQTNIIIECSNIDSSDRVYKIVNALGREINKLIIPANYLAVDMDISQLSRGIYYIVNESNVADYSKFIKF